MLRQGGGGPVRFPFFPIGGNRRQQPWERWWLQAPGQVAVGAGGDGGQRDPGAACRQLLATLQAAMLHEAREPTVMFSSTAKLRPCPARSLPRRGLQLVWVTEPRRVGWWWSFNGEILAASTGQPSGTGSVDGLEVVTSLEGFPRFNAVLGAIRFRSSRALSPFFLSFFVAAHRSPIWLLLPLLASGLVSICLIPNP